MLQVGKTCDDTVFRKRQELVSQWLGSSNLQGQSQMKLQIDRARAELYRRGSECVLLSVCNDAAILGQDSTIPNGSREKCPSRKCCALLAERLESQCKRAVNSNPWKPKPHSRHRFLPERACHRASTPQDSEWIAHHPAVLLIQTPSPVTSALLEVLAVSSDDE
ncbi:hypothetical protein GY45DRAFT_251570 [Cubamyces sp. BRFM 1775]|nr:hypothetical protein GY45DRAFT_251570 [Cubamyces sp. BRFM 1775]